MKYDDIINDLSIMDWQSIIDSYTKRINRICRDVSNHIKYNWFEECLNLYEIKRQLLLKYNLFFVTYNKLQDKERFILYNYLYRNNTCFQVSKILKISTRTFFRLLEKTCNKYRKYRSIVYANHKVSYSYKGSTKNTRH